MQLIVNRLICNAILTSAQVITNLDQRWGLWQKTKAEDTNGSEEKKEKEEEEKADSNLGITSTNPVLNNITDYLVST